MVEKLRREKERELKQRKEELERIRIRQLEEEEQRKKNQKMQQELKTKDFTYDADGNIVFIQTIKPDKLPNSYLGATFLDVKTEKTEEPKKKKKKEKTKAEAKKTNFVEINDIKTSKQT